MNRIRSIRALRCATALAAVLACAAGVGGAAQAADLTYVFSVRSEPLGQALQELALQSGRTILFDEHDVHGLMAPSVSGRYSLEQVLDRLTRASGLRYSVTSGNVIIVQHQQTAGASGPKLVRVATEFAPAAETPASAPTGPSTLQEVVVTANRRAESAQLVPVSVSVVSAANIRAMGVTDTNALTGKIPSLSINPTAATLYFLRGVGTTATSNNVEQSVASYIDGVYLYSTWSAAVPLSGVDRVEVLKGPQGTLFGRNTTGGVIQTVTRDPMRAPTLEASVGYGDYDTTTATLYAATKPTPQLGVSVAVDYTNQGRGYGYNPVINQRTLYSDTFSIQTKAVYQPNADSKLTGFFWYDDHKDSADDFELAPGYKGVGGYAPAPGFYETEFNTPNDLHYHSYLGYLRYDQDLGFANMAIISSYRKVISNFDLDQDQIPLTVVNVNQQLPLHDYSEEFQLLSPSGSRITWIVGAYYFNAEAQTDPITLLGTGAGPAGKLQYYRTQRTRSVAGFGQASAEILPATKLTVGLRYTGETETLVPGATVVPGSPVTMSPSGTVDSSGFTWRLALDHRFTKDVMGYVSYNRGLKSGGFTLITTANIPPYRPEHLDAYEIGLKSELFNRHLRLNGSFYYYLFKDIAIAHVTTGGTVVGNAAAAQIKGVDLDFDADVARNLQVSGSFGWLDGYYSSFPGAVGYKPNPAGGSTTFTFDASGNTTVFSPTWSATLGANYRIPSPVGDFNLNGFLQYVDKQYVGPDNTLDIPSHTVVNGTLAWTSLNKALTVSIWAKNLFDLKYYANVSESTLGDNVLPAAPRTFGVTLSVKY